MTRRRLVASWVITLAVTLLVSGCVSSGGGGRGLGGRPQAARGGNPSGAANAGVAPLLREVRTPILTSDDLFRVYELVMQNYVDPVEPQVLIEGAIRGFAAGVETEAMFPMDAVILEGANLRYTADAQRDWAAFEARYDTFVGKLGPRIGVGAIGQSTVQGMLSVLNDADTTYTERLPGSEGPSSSYVGIGVILATPDRTPIIREVISGGPAERAGLRAGDRIVGVDRQPTDTTPPETTIQRIRGAEGTNVTLTVTRGASSLEVRVTRAPVTLQPVSSSLSQGIGYLRIRTFQDGVPEAVYDALQQFSRAGAVAWIVDLRGNRGGDIEEAVRTASLFVGDQVIGLQVDRSRRQAAIQSSGQPLLTVLPTAILVDSETGSGAELFSSALQEYRVALVIGTKTAGNAGLSSTQVLPDGSTVRITTRRILSPSGVPIQGNGVKADVVAETTPEDWSRGRDPQLDQTMTLLITGSQLSTGAENGRQ